MAHLRDRALAVRPVARQPRPRYPSFESFARDPARLLRYVPPRWRRCRIALGALTAFALGRLAPAEEAGSAATARTEQAPQAEARGERAAVPQALVAPVFVHGEGRGATGCVAISPPVFLSEAEALEILWDELRGAGLGFERQPHAAALPSKSDEPPLVYDFWSPTLRLGVTFVGEHNYAQLASRPPNLVVDEDGSFGFSTVGDYDTLAVAQTTVELLRTSHAESAGVLYDPLVRMVYPAPGQPAPRNPREEARALLRAQLADFVAWARAELGRGLRR